MWWLEKNKRLGPDCENPVSPIVEVAVAVSLGLVILHMKSMRPIRLFSMSRNWVTLWRSVSLWWAGLQISKHKINRHKCTRYKRKFNLRLLKNFFDHKPQCKPTRLMYFIKYNLWPSCCNPTPTWYWPVRHEGWLQTLIPQSRNASSLPSALCTPKAAQATFLLYRSFFLVRGSTEHPSAALLTGLEIVRREKSSQLLFYALTLLYSCDWWQGESGNSQNGIMLACIGGEFCTSLGIRRVSSSAYNYNRKDPQNELNKKIVFNVLL